MVPEPHPCKGVLALMRLSVRAVADEAGVSAHFCGRAINGHVRPSPKVRAAVVKLTGLPEVLLFRDAS